MNGQVVLVSGGSRGLGQEVVKDVLLRGGTVATFSRHATPFVDAERAKDPEGLRFVWEAIDGMDISAVTRFVTSVARRYGRIDALVNNAGIVNEQLLALTRSDDVHKLLTVNLELPIRLAQACARVMLVQRSGVMVNVSSLNAIRGHTGVAVYSATKAALDGLTRSLAHELGPAGIRVNSIAPGYFESEMTRSIGAKEKERIIRRTPLRRLGEVADVVAVVRFLLSPDARFMTGQTLVVDGGITC